MNNQLQITMPDGSKWQVPVEVIANHRAKHYAIDFDGYIQKSLELDTLPVFEDDLSNIHDWASNNMNWSDVQKHAIMVKPGKTDYQKGWVNGDWEIVAPRQQGQ
jgi:hypothetical protein